jgi:hypothetical protein
MANGDNGTVNWNRIRDIAQILIYPLLAAMVYLLLQVATFDRRLAIIEVTMARPTPDLALAQKIAVIEDRQNSVIQRLNENGVKMDRIQSDLMNHDDRAGGSSRGR